MDLQTVWKEYGLDKLEAGMTTLFPQYDLSLTVLFQKILAGDVLEALEYLVNGSISGVAAQFTGMKNIFIWLVVLGVISAMLTHFVHIFDRRQVADLSFYYIYLLFSMVLLKCFTQAAQTAESAIENIILFVKLLVPTYIAAVGVTTGSVTVSAYSQVMVLVIYGVEKILLGCVIPFIFGYIILAVVNSIWAEEKLALLIELLEKAVGWILKAAMGVVTGVSIFQSVISPMVDSVKRTALQKTVAMIPGVGDAAEGVTELVTGSALVIKNSIGVVLLILLLVLCAAPLLQIVVTALLFKGAAAFMGIVSDKRITNCANRMGDAGMLLFRTTGTAMVLFLIVIAIVATVGKG